MFREKDPDNDGPDFAASMSQLGAVMMIDPVLAMGSKGGYTFTTAAGTSDPNALFWVTANPSTPTVTGYRYFACNLSGVVFYSTAAPITPDPATGTIPPGLNPAGS